MYVFVSLKALWFCPGAVTKLRVPDKGVSPWVLALFYKNTLGLLFETQGCGDRVPLSVCIEKLVPPVTVL